MKFDVFQTICAIADSAPEKRREIQCWSRVHTVVFPLTPRQELQQADVVLLATGSGTRRRAAYAGVPGRDQANQRSITRDVTVTDTGRGSNGLGRKMCPEMH